MPEESSFQNNSVFFIDIDKIRPNPYQPRHDFDEARLQDLADSIRMYGLLQPLTVSRKEITKPDGGIATEYELIAGERRLRASKIIGLREVPALIRSKEDDARTKLELAIIENLQREDLSAIDRARAFARLADEFGFKHVEIAKKVGKSREYVSNTIRLLLLPEEMQMALQEKKISEGHTRPLLMLCDRPEEQNTLFREIMLKKMSVRDAERVSRKIAVEKVRKPDRTFGDDIVELEQFVGDILGTRVHIQPKENGGKIEIDYFSEEDLREILHKIGKKEDERGSDVIDDDGDSANNLSEFTDAVPVEIENENLEGSDEVFHSKNMLGGEDGKKAVHNFGEKSEEGLWNDKNEGADHYDILNPEPEAGATTAELNENMTVSQESATAPLQTQNTNMSQDFSQKPEIEFVSKPEILDKTAGSPSVSVPIVEPNKSDFVPPPIHDMKMSMSGNAVTMGGEVAPNNPPPAMNLQDQIQADQVQGGQIQNNAPVVEATAAETPQPASMETPSGYVDKYREDPGTVTYPLPPTPDTPLHNDNSSAQKSIDDGDFTINDFKI